MDIKIQKTSQSKIKNIDFDNLVFGQNHTDHMFQADFIDGKWQNLRVEPYANLSLDPATSSCLLYTSPSPRDQRGSRMPSSA